MKLRPDILLAAAIAGTVGFLAGKYLIPTPTADHLTESTVMSGKSFRGGPSGQGDVPKPVVNPTREQVALFQVRHAALTPEAFGQRYAELLAGANSAETLLERAIMLTSLDADRAIASYLAYKTLTGVAPGKMSLEIQPMLTVAGQCDGAGMMTAMQKLAPDFFEVASLVHGWALSDPSAAVAWYNGLPDDAAQQRKGGLKGLMYGLAQRDAGVAKEVFHSLSTEDQATSGSLLTQSVLSTHGTDAVDRLLTGLPPAVVRQCLDGSFERGARRPPPEMVPWLATHLGTSGTVDQIFLQSWSSWATSAPAEAERWRTAAVAANPRIAPLLEHLGQSPLSPLR